MCRSPALITPVSCGCRGCWVNAALQDGRRRFASPSGDGRFGSDILLFLSFVSEGTVPSARPPEARNHPTAFTLRDIWPFFSLLPSLTPILQSLRKSPSRCVRGLSSRFLEEEAKRQVEPNRKSTAICSVCKIRPAIVVLHSNPTFIIRKEQSNRSSPDGF